MVDDTLTSLLQDLEVLGAVGTLCISQDVHTLLDQLLKMLVEDKSSITEKLNVVQFLEQKSSLLLQDITDVELVIATFKNICETSFNEKHQLLYGQFLIAATTILLESFEKFVGGELDEMFSHHVNALLGLVHKSNKSNNAYVRSVAAACLIEIELCFPLLLRPCLDNIYALAVAEISIAHQQYTSLLSLLMKNNLTNSALGTPLWNKYPELVLQSKFVGQNDVVAKSSLPSNNQLLSFLVDQLPVCTSEGAVWVTNHIIDMLLHNSELQAYCQVLKPLFFNCVYTYNISEFHLLLSLERACGAELFGDQEHSLFVKQLLLNCSHPLMSLSSRLIFLDCMDYYLLRTGHKLSSQDVSLIMPNFFDGPEIQLKKFIFLSNLLNDVKGTSRFLLLLLNNMRREINCKNNAAFKSAFIKALYTFFKNHDEICTEDISRTLLVTMTDDVTMTPFVLHFIHEVQETAPKSSLPLSILSSLVSVFTQPDNSMTMKNLTFIVDIFQASVSKKCSNESLKAVLVYLSKNILKEDVCGMLPWLVGHKILKLCYTLMREYNTTDFFYELNDVLQGFVSTCENEDIQDRARLYLGLLVSLSNKKLKAVLQGPKQALPHILLDDTNFHPKASFQILEKPIVNIFKVNSTVPCLKKLDLTSIGTSDIDGYYKNFIRSNPCLKQLTLQISVKLSDEFQEIRCVEALAIFASASEEWGKVDPIMIGHFRDTKMSDQGNNLVVNMVCHPHYPRPSQLQMRAEFSLENMCHTCSLWPFQIAFSDFFCPLPVSGEVSNLFKSLWNNLEDNYFSVVALEKSEKCVHNYVGKYLSSFIVYKDEGLYHTAIFLPPEKHLLMKFQINAQRTIVKINTDYIDVLGLTSNFFNNWIREIE